MLRQQAPMSFFILFIFVFITITISGCQKQPAEKAFEKIQEAIKNKDLSFVWNTLSKRTKQAFAKYAKQLGTKEKVKALFLRGKMKVFLNLRTDSKNNKITPKKATLFFRDNLNQPIEVKMIYEKKQWHLDLQH